MRHYINWRLVIVAAGLTMAGPRTCVMPWSRDDGADDTPLILSAINACGNNSRVVFESGITYRVHTPWKIENLHDVEFVFRGNLSLSENITAVQAVVRDPRRYPGQWFRIRGERLIMTGSSDDGGGWFICGLPLVSVSTVV
jgi:galacturan 1,4-alpha-galacturonidase